MKLTKQQQANETAKNRVYKDRQGITKTFREWIDYVKTNKYHFIYCSGSFQRIKIADGTGIMGDNEKIITVLELQ